MTKRSPYLQIAQQRSSNWMTNLIKILKVYNRSKQRNIIYQRYSGAHAKMLELNFESGLGDVVGAKIPNYLLKKRKDIPVHKKEKKFYFKPL
eukprot:snap_masked-scaffold_13-processed-gene-0.32-mRNA-1 protein AED:1.00 eAED:1.00 QI:0/-1/0/0/-1/1/1/0/91